MERYWATVLPDIRPAIGRGPNSSLVDLTWLDREFDRLARGLHGVDADEAAPDSTADPAVAGPGPATSASASTSTVGTDVATGAGPDTAAGSRFAGHDGTGEVPEAIGRGYTGQDEWATNQGITARSAGWLAIPAGPKLAAALGSVDLGNLDDGETLDYLVCLKRLQSWADSREIAALARFNEHRPVNVAADRNTHGLHRDAGAEVALATHQATRTANKRLADAVHIHDHMPATFEAMDRGNLDWTRARIIADHAATIYSLDENSHNDAAEFEATLLETAADLPYGRLEDKARKLRERMHPETIETRHRAEAARRDVTFIHQPDAMIDVYAHLPADAGARIRATIDTYARSLQGPDENRTLGQLRADVFADLLMTNRPAHTTLTGLIGLTADDFTRPSADHRGVNDRGVNDRAADDRAALQHAIAAASITDDTTRCGTIVGSADTGLASAASATAVLDSAGPVCPHCGSSTAATRSKSTSDAPADQIGTLSTTGSSDGNPPTKTGPPDKDPPLPRGPASLVVTIPTLTLTGTGTAPAELEGYGPIPIQMARKLVANQPSYLPMLTDPFTGARLALGRRYRKPPADLARWIMMRDQQCQFPGCARNAVGTEIDHTKAWAEGGETNHDNNCLLCKVHHVTKHRPGFDLRQPAPGVLVWTTPTGHTYTTGMPDHPSPDPDAFQHLQGSTGEEPPF